MKLLLAFLLFTSTCFANTVVQGLLNQANQAKENYEDGKAIQLFQEVLALDSNNFQALWKISYLYSRAGWLAEQEEQKVFYHKKAVAYARKTHAKYPETFEANFVLAGTIARHTEFQSPKERVQAAWDIKKYAEKALKLNPSHPEVWYLLGWWNFEIAKASWLERSFANVLFGGLPDGASFEEAIDCLKKAIQLRPNYSVYLFDLATFYHELGNQFKSKALLKVIFSLAPSVPEDIFYLRNARKLFVELQ